VAALGCGEDPNGSTPMFPADAAVVETGPPGPIVPVGPPMMGLHIVGNQIINADGAAVALHGVNRSGTEYQCTKTNASTIFDGPSDVASIQAMATWKVNAVRIPLNESCWLAINGAQPGLSGVNYKQGILAYVAILHQFNIVPILDLHWVGPGTTLATMLQPLPDADHASDFWIDVAKTFASDLGVVFELYNEPFPDSNRDSTTGWQCWRDGCMAKQAGQSTTTMYQTVGMQALLDGIRDPARGGAMNVVLLGGLQYSNALTQWLQYAPTDSMVPSNIGAAWHVYNFNSCVSADCWDNAPTNVAAMVPIVATEIGENDCASGTFIQSLMAWLDLHGEGYLAWSWNAFGACVAAPPMMQGGQPWSLINSYVTGTPNSGYATGFHDHLLQLAGP
jgi:hypothetical protein